MRDARSYYSSLGDEALLDAYLDGPNAYRPDVWQFITHEIARRHLDVSTAARTPLGKPPSQTIVEHVLGSDTAQFLFDGFRTDSGLTSADHILAQNASSPQTSEETKAEIEQAIVDANNQVRTGVLLLGVGLSVTLGTFLLASGEGGTYVVAWGAVVFGAVRIVRGQSRLERLREMPR